MLLLDQKIPPGLSANELEIYWDHEKEDLFGLYSGRNYRFEELPSEVFKMLEDVMTSDSAAMQILEAKGPSNLRDRLYIYSKCAFGGFSFEPDLSSHGISTSECWDCGCNGHCVLKPIMRGKLQVKNGFLTEREIDVIKKLTSSEYKIGDAVAAELGIRASTLNKHKRAIYQKIGVDSIQALSVWASKMDLS